jgi:hypothetical protein
MTVSFVDNTEDPIAQHYDEYSFSSSSWTNPNENEIEEEDVIHRLIFIIMKISMMKSLIYQ